MLAPQRIASLALVALSLVVFAASLPFVAAHYTVKPWHGYEMLMIGWMGPLFLHFGWLANPLLLVVAILVAVGGRTPSRVAIVTAAVALVIALSSFVTLRTFEMIGRHEGETAGAFLGFGPAIVLWTLSFVLALSAAVLGHRHAAAR